MEKGAEKKNNFKIALDEIMKGKLSTSPENKEQEKLFEQSEEPKKVEQVIIPLVRKGPENSNLNNIPDFNAESTIISEGTVIEGSIITKSNLVVQGDVNGDIESEKDIEIIGRIVGNVKGNNTIFLKGSINGNVSGPNVLTLTKDAKVFGDINCQELECDGNITGNINAASSVYLGANSMIKGNVVSKSISIKEGSQIKGSLEIL